MGKQKWNTELVKKLVEENDGYELIGEYIPKTNSRIDIYHESCEKISNIQLRHFINGIRCIHCNPYKKKTHGEFLIQCHIKFDYFNEYKFIEEYVNKNTEILVRHICGYEYKVKPDNFLQGKQCSKCRGVYRKNTTEFINMVHKKIPETKKEIVISGEYKNGSTLMNIKCVKCNHQYTRQANNILKSIYKCPLCHKNISSGVYLITQYLKDNNIIFDMEKRFDDCRHKKPLPFDFYLPEYRICIEYDGQHHFKPIEHWGGEDEFLNTQMRDNIKNQYCLEHDITLIRISYMDDINSILHETISSQDSSE